MERLGELFGIPDRKAQIATMKKVISNAVAKHFKVSGIAVKYRLQNLSILKPDELTEIEDSGLKWIDTAPKPQIYSKAFAEKLKKVLERGLVSTRKTAKLLDCMVEDIKDIILSYGLKTDL